jgi:hypothetical protein
MKSSHKGRRSFREVNDFNTGFIDPSELSYDAQQNYIKNIITSTLRKSGDWYVVSFKYKNKCFKGKCSESFILSQPRLLDNFIFEVGLKWEREKINQVSLKQVLEQYLEPNFSTAHPNTKTIDIKTLFS